MKEVFKKDFYNYKTLIIVLSFITLSILSIKYSFFLYPLSLITIIIIMSLVSFLNEVKFIKEVYSYKNGLKKFSYKPYIISTNELLDIIKTYGLALTYIKIKNIYAIEVVKQEENYTCYIDEKEINNLDDFLKYNIDDTQLSKTNKITILAYNDGDPKDISLN